MLNFQILIYFSLFVTFVLYNAVFFNLFNFQLPYSKNKTQHRKNVGSNNSFIGQNGRLIIVLIDAMRYDFIFESNDKIRMPFVHRLIREKKAIPFKLTASPPTVTLPRIKALVSGIIPEFIDILWNFNTTNLLEDNLLKKFKEKNKSIIFYGDDTWLKLFNPEEYFIRYEGTTSFIASDYDEVDSNVSRHLNFELEQTDWDMMILHYLGLDHVGHIEGPYAPLNIRRKLHEMDQIIKKIYSKLNNEDLFLILSDHGMANEGGHGGSSQMEITTPVLFASKGLFGQKYHFVKDEEISNLMNSIKIRNQIDLVSTISCLFNLDVPEHNKGIIFLSDLINNLEEYNRDKSLIINCLKNNYDQLNSLLNFDDENDFSFEKIHENFDEKSLEHLEQMIRNRVEQKLNSEKKNKDQNFYLISLILVMFVILTIYIIRVNGMKRLLKLSHLRVSKDYGLRIFFLFSFTLHLISLFSSSFIEEEHQIWYFIGTTQVYLIFFITIRQKLYVTQSKQQLFYFMLLLIIIRFMRGINQTGNKWIHVKDLGDYLKE
ncbi:unnamed protein product [Brachionus calyciflorus]|uniref:GPI ethanolamine phosphate transferase 2 C-terminal domain-containing protein n=1 Tax=Brachionus calyciflorus TaxID=104777 RepID=A0A813MYE5_9BILA|nr:unnamed protein product [Brachionus calyciflorus]